MTHQPHQLLVLFMGAWLAFAGCGSDKDPLDTGTDTGTDNNDDSNAWDEGAWDQATFTN